MINAPNPDWQMIPVTHIIELSGFQDNYWDAHDN